jgi:hypothetical protein
LCSGDSPARHRLCLEELTPRLIADNVTALLEFAYAELELGFQSFNLAIHGAATGDPDPRLAPRVVARTYFGPLQRSDVMWSERLYGELATDIRPEKLADLARDLFAST